MYRTWWEVALQNWPMAIFVPAVLVVLATLAVITRIVDGADGPRTAETDAGRRAVDPAEPPAAIGSSTAADPPVDEAPTAYAGPDTGRDAAPHAPADVASDVAAPDVTALDVAAVGGDGDGHADRADDDPGDRPQDQPAPAAPDRLDSAPHGSMAHR